MKELLSRLLPWLAAVLIISVTSAAAQDTDALNPPGYFSEDYYKVTGGPKIAASMESSSVYQGEDTSLFLTLSNQGSIESFRVNTMPDRNRQDEMMAAQKELELEGQRTVARDISLKLVAINNSAMRIKRQVAYAGSLKEGQLSPRLEFPLEVYENTDPGAYELLAIPNYTYQRDVAVVANSDRPQDPDIYFWYDSASATIPISLIIERKSGVEIKALETYPSSLLVGSKDNLVRIAVKNVGNDTAKDLVARLRPESGIYVDMDESPIPILQPGQTAELVYKIDISKDAIAGKAYQFTLLFEFSDSYRKDLKDSDHVYLTLDSSWKDMRWWAGAGLLLAALLALILKARKKMALP
jgi:hypothetical protein